MDEIVVAQPKSIRCHCSEHFSRAYKKFIVRDYHRRKHNFKLVKRKSFLIADTVETLFIH